MKEIVVISGKGGCGKTSITAALAIVAGEQIVLSDTDVDAADMHMLMFPEESHKEEFFSGEIAHVEPASCTSCITCVDACRFDAIAMNEEGVAEVHALDCEACGLCARLCPVEAIQMKPARAGIYMEGTARTGAPMVHAKMDIAADNSGKLVTYVKNKAIEMAQKTGKNYVLVDGPPGIGCPVIAALSGADAAILVTEPTESGFHDVKRAHELCMRMGTKVFMIMNKEGLNDTVSTAIKAFAKKHGFHILGAIPYHNDIPKALSRGKTLAESGNAALESAMVDMWQHVLEKLGE